MQAGLDHPCARPVEVDAPPSSQRPSGHPVRRVLTALLLAFALLVAGALPTLAHPSQAARVVRAVESHIGARYSLGATGPRTFDCSGLVFRSFKEAGLSGRIGGNDTAHGYLTRFRRLGRVSRVAPRVGDLVVYSNGGHVGIYVGRGKVVSALLSGVKRHPMRGLNIPFTGILRVTLTRGTSRVEPASAKRTVHRRVVVADRKLPVRANPGPGSSAVGTIKRGTRLVVYGTRKRRGATWLRVRYDHGRGWINEGMTSAR